MLMILLISQNDNNLFYNVRQFSSTFFIAPLILYSETYLIETLFLNFTLTDAKSSYQSIKLHVT